MTKEWLFILKHPPHFCDFFLLLMPFLSLSMFVSITCMFATRRLTRDTSFGSSPSLLPHGVTSCESKPRRQRSRCNSARLLRWSADNYIIIREQTGNVAKMTRQHFLLRKPVWWWRRPRWWRLQTLKTSVISSNSMFSFGNNIQ